MYGINGREVFSTESGSSSIVIDTSTLPAGIYVLKVRIDDGSVTEKVVVAH